MLKNILTIMGLTLAINSSCASAAVSEITLMKKIAADGLLEVELGTIGEKRALNNDAKKFAQQMVIDQSKANDELKQVADKRKIELPKELTVDQKQKKKFLETCQKKAFDGAYMKDMVEGHKKAIAAVTQATKIGTTDFKSWAEKTLPVIQHHSHEAKGIEAKLPKYN